MEMEMDDMVTEETGNSMQLRSDCEPYYRQQWQQPQQLSNSFFANHPLTGNDCITTPISTNSIPVNGAHRQQLRHHQQQQLDFIQSFAQQQSSPRTPYSLSGTQVLPLPLPAFQKTLLVSPTTGAIIGVEPMSATMLQQQQPFPTATIPPLPPVIHNLIPEHLQASSLAPSLHGTPGHQPALVSPHQLAAVVAANNLLQLVHHSSNQHPQQQQQHNNNARFSSAANNDAAVTTSAILSSLMQFQAQCVTPPPTLNVPVPIAAPSPIALTVQDRPSTIPVVYNGVNLSYPGVRQIHHHPPVFVVDNFLNATECDFLIHAAGGNWAPAPVVGKGAGEISPSRTSSTCYLAREDVPDYMRKVSLLTSKPIIHCELPQVGRYLYRQQYLHRVVTVLVYLNDCSQGGQTQFPALNLEVSPRRGTALVFFPATIDGYLDKMALHAALPAIDTKFVSQVWIRQGNYYGQPSKRLQNTLGVPFDVTGQDKILLGIQPQY